VEHRQHDFGTIGEQGAQRHGGNTDHGAWTKQLGGDRIGRVAAGSRLADGFTGTGDSRNVDRVVRNAKEQGNMPRQHNEKPRRRIALQKQNGLGWVSFNNGRRGQDLKIARLQRG
jgi:hypothetical protein